MIEATSILEVRCQLGEGPLWDPNEQALWFVDIEARALHRYDPLTGRNDTYPQEGRPSFAVMRAAGGLIVGIENTLVRVERGVVVETLATIPMPRENRTNDATVDAEGLLWFGTMDSVRGPVVGSGQVYCYDGALHESGADSVITNGPAVSPDGATLYHVDTLERRIWSFDISGGRRRLEGGKLFAEFAVEDGHPDGVTVDSEGAIWVGLWDGGALRRYSSTGALLQTVRFPCANVTKVAFGGPDFRTGYVTTAWTGLSEAERAKQPQAGNLFAFEAPAPGLSQNRVRF